MSQFEISDRAYPLLRQSPESIGLSLAMSHKVTIPGTKWEAVFKQKNYLYNYLLRWLLERVSDVCFRVHSKK